MKPVFPEKARVSRSRETSALPLSRDAHIMGVVVRDTAMEMSTATERTTANSLNRLPSVPGMQRIGMKMATRERDMETTVKQTSRDPLREARSGVSPSSSRRTMFSRTTMASSTTKPVAMVRAMRERLSSV